MEHLDENRPHREFQEKSPSRNKRSQECLGGGDGRACLCSGDGLDEKEITYEVCVAMTVELQRFR